MANLIQDKEVQCTRCRNKHKFSERIEKRKKNFVFVSMVCPRCGGESYFDLSEKEVQDDDDVFDPDYIGPDED